MPRRGRSLAAAAAALLVVLTACTAGGARGDPTPVTSVRVEPMPQRSPQAVAVPLDGASAGPPSPAWSVPVPVPAPTPESARAVFASSIEPISAALATRMATSWHRGCPVPLADLRHVTLTHWDMSGRAVTGELVVHADVADSVVAIFRLLFDARFPIASMRLVDDFGGSDDASMAADNTSAFNCRAVTGGTSWSEHSYGRAIDVDPVENPYVDGRVAPPAGAAFLDRHPAPGVIRPGDVVVRAFAAYGWTWGGSWATPVDYQHFSTSGR